MKMILVILLSLFSLTAYSQTVSLTITGDNKPLEAVHVIKGGQVLAVSDSLGRVSLPLQDRDGDITLSHLLYEEVTLPAPVKDTVLSLQPKVFRLDQSTYSLADGWPALKEAIKPGLSLGHTLKEVYPFSSVDTLYYPDRKHFFSVDGSAVFYSSHKRPVVLIDTVTDIENHKQMTKKSEKEMKRWFSKSMRNKMMIGQFYAVLLCATEPREGMIVEYQGKDHEHDIFRFYEPPIAMNDNAKVRGLAYVNAHTGILERVQVTLTPINVHFSTLYEMDIRYAYFESSNSILPSENKGISYTLNDERSVVAEHRYLVTISH